MLVLFFVLVPRCPKRQGPRETSPEEASLAGLKADPVCYPACPRFSRTAGVNLRNGMPYFRQLRVVLLHLLGSIVLRGGWDLDMPLSPHYLRRIRSPPYIQGALRDHCSGWEATKSIEPGNPRSQGAGGHFLAASRTAFFKAAWTWTFWDSACSRAASASA